MIVLVPVWQGNGPVRALSVSGESGTGDAVLQTNGTLISPRILSDIHDSQGNTLLGLYEVSSADDFLAIWNAVSGDAVVVATDGASANISINVEPKGSGLFLYRGTEITSEANFGYHTGSGGTVTQITSKATGVTLDKSTGQITTHNAALGTLSAVTFTVTCSAVGANDVVALSHVGGGTAGAYLVSCSGVAAGSFKVTIFNTSIGPLSEALVIGYAVVKGATS